MSLRDIYGNTLHCAGSATKHGRFIQGNLPKQNWEAEPGLTARSLEASATCLWNVLRKRAASKNENHLISCLPSPWHCFSGRAGRGSNGVSEKHQLVPAWGSEAQPPASDTEASPSARCCRPYSREAGCLPTAQPSSLPSPGCQLWSLPLPCTANCSAPGPPGPGQTPNS